FNVAPTEVEHALTTAEEVAEAAVVGLRGEDGSEVVVAAVVTSPDRTFDEARLREHCYGKVTRYKVPRRIIELDELPRTMLGKIQRREVRQQLEQLGVDLARRS
ncbi:MAG: long-chain fatty acid--CoA ligase, partial [Micrococcales bacterium]|nr:long-chain fatty acid--CoA ligase [Micrococcales bacterium]